ncbi:MAG: thiamine-phosphate kinase, partial [Spirochaetes bacterium]
MKLYQIGERRIIKEISKILPDVDLTDDCARIAIDDKYLLVSTDLISEKTHIPKIMTPWQ